MSDSDSSPLSDLDDDDSPWHEEANDVFSDAQTSPSQRVRAGTSMDSASKRRVDSATAGEGLLSGKRCLIENTDKANVIHYAHCLARATKDFILDALEFSWGMPYHTLNLDTRYNVFRLSSKFHSLYDNKLPMCILLPEERIIQQYYNARKDRKKFPEIDEPSYKYKFLAHDDMVSVPIHRLTPPDNLAVAPPATSYTYFAHPYATFDPLISHVHPRFVICDAGKKLEESGTTFAVFSRLYPNHMRSLEMAAAIWKAWTKFPNDTAFEAFREDPYTGDNMSSTSKRTAKKRLFPPAGRRGGGGKNETPTRASKRSKLGQGANDGIWLDDETLREHDNKVSSKVLWKQKNTWISDWSKDVSKTGAVEPAMDLDMATGEVQ